MAAEDFDFQPYRILQSSEDANVDVDDAGAVNTTVPSEFENLILDDVGASW